MLQNTVSTIRFSFWKDWFWGTSHVFCFVPGLKIDKPIIFCLRYGEKCRKNLKNCQYIFCSLCKCQLLKVIKTISYTKVFNQLPSKVCENLLEHLISCVFSHTLSNFSHWKLRKQETSVDNPRPGEEFLTKEILQSYAFNTSKYLCK